MRYKDLAELEARLGSRAAVRAAEAMGAREALQAQAQRSKMGNVRVERPDGKFDSKLEARVYDRLVLEHDGREQIIRQLSFGLEDLRMRPDFLIIYERLPGGTKFIGEFADAKGRITPEWKAKANHFHDKHGLGIRLIFK